MRIPIPNDWQPGDDWLCVEIQWPDSDQYLGLLFGLLTELQRGRFWDERSGSVIAAQEVGYSIAENNTPITLCGGSQVTQHDTEYIARFVGAMEQMQMSLCGYNPKAFKIENGQLWVRDFCGEWVAIGVLASGPDLPDVTIIPDDPPGDLGDATACSMVTKLADFVVAIITEAWIELDVDDPADIYDFISDMTDKFPGVDLAFSNLFNMYFNMLALDAAGLENECKDSAIPQYLKCAWVDLITARNTGITSGEYSAIISATEGAMREAVGDSRWYGFGRTMRYVWQDAVASIGAKDAQKITYYAQSKITDDCSCPMPETETDPSENGWYLSAPLDTALFDIPYDVGGSDPLDVWGYAYGKQAAQHDIFGYIVTLELVSGSMGIAKRSNDAQAHQGTYDVFLSGSNSDAYSLPKLQAQMNESEYQELGLGPLGYTRVQPLSGDGYTDENDPPVDGGEIALMSWSLQRDGANLGVGRMSNLRWLHNVNSPSHS